YFRTINNPLEMELRQAKKLTTKRNDFYADPHIMSNESHYKILFENYIGSKGKAKISAVDICKRTGKVGNTHDMIDELYHLSFPFSFKYKNKDYLTVESGSMPGIRIYKFLEDGSVIYDHTVMENTHYADPIIFKRDNFWFLIANVDVGGVRDFNSELHVYRASDPICGDWVAVGQNSVSYGAKNARNAGLINIGNSLFRVNQIQGFNFYGKGFGLNEIIISDNGEYSEKRIYTTSLLYPDGIEGIHTLHTNDGLLVFDGYK
ncbi:hypothetical protein N9J49_07660, partial [Amylibacter sp.]|nr:hypothetical protein [Amylibacter sp.]